MPELRSIGLSGLRVSHWERIDCELTDGHTTVLVLVVGGGDHVDEEKDENADNVDDDEDEHDEQEDGANGNDGDHHPSCH